MRQEDEILTNEKDSNQILELVSLESFMDVSKGEEIDTTDLAKGSVFHLTGSSIIVPNREMPEIAPVTSTPIPKSVTDVSTISTRQSEETTPTVSTYAAKKCTIAKRVT